MQAHPESKFFLIPHLVIKIVNFFLYILEQPVLWKCTPHKAFSRTYSSVFGDAEHTCVSLGICIHHLWLWQHSPREDHVRDRKAHCCTNLTSSLSTAWKWFLLAKFVQTTHRHISIYWRCSLMRHPVSADEDLQNFRPGSMFCVHLFSQEIFREWTVARRNGTWNLWEHTFALKYVPWVSMKRELEVNLVKPSSDF